jgi:hypothetical protein
LNPQDFSRSNTDNAVWGYLADGFFDRGALSNNTVGSGTEVAYRGQLFYNSITNASVFIPASGLRNYNTGQLLYAGNNGFYWSRSSYNGSNGWNLYVAGGTYPSNNTRTYGFSVRCVYDPQP